MDRRANLWTHHHSHPWSNVQTTANISLPAPSVTSPAKKVEWSSSPYRCPASHPPPAGTHSKVRLSNLHFNALQKLPACFLLSLCSAVKSSCCRWCHMTGNKLSPELAHTQIRALTIAHLLMFYFVKFIDVRCPLRVKLWDSQSAYQLLI